VSISFEPLSRLPDHILSNHNVIGLLNRKAQQHARKVVVEQELESCEEHMQSLRNELFEVDRNLQAAQKCVDTLQSFTLQFQPGDRGEFSGYPLASSSSSNSSQNFIAERGD
jgi:hypothetical protein